MRQIFSNIVFLSGLGRNPYKVSIDKRDLWRYLGSLVLLGIIKIPLAILCIPLLIMFVIIVVIGGVLAGINFLYEKLLIFMQWLPLPVAFHKFLCDNLKSKYSLRMREKTRLESSGMGIDADLIVADTIRATPRTEGDMG